MLILNFENFFFFFFFFFLHGEEKHKFSFLEFAVNVCVDIPTKYFKHILVEMDNNQMIDMNDDIHKFCV